MAGLHNWDLRSEFSILLTLETAPEYFLGTNNPWRQKCCVPRTVLNKRVPIGLPSMHSHTTLSFHNQYSRGRFGNHSSGFFSFHLLKKIRFLMFSWNFSCNLTLSLEYINKRKGTTPLSDH
jgi:hypothetical protein